MDKKISLYARLVQQLIAEEAAVRAVAGVEYQQIGDTKRHHFQLVETGWYEKRYLHNVLFHFHIKQGKVWLLANNTEMLVAEELIKRGIPAQDIVIAFHPIAIRSLTGFAAA